MKQGNQKKKGNLYEIKISRILSNWYRDMNPQEQVPKKNHDFFWRTAGSGAKSTITRRGETSFVGDITFLPNPDKLGIWIDCKSVKTITFNNLLTNTFLPFKWYNEELEKMYNLSIIKPVVIIFKLYGKKDDYIFFRASDFKYFKFGLVKDTLYLEPYAVTRLNNFLQCMDREEIIND
jgi:hypothetical protein